MTKPINQCCDECAKINAGYYRPNVPNLDSCSCKCHKPSSLCCEKCKDSWGGGQTMLPLVRRCLNIDCECRNLMQTSSKPMQPSSCDHKDTIETCNDCSAVWKWGTIAGEMPEPTEPSVWEKKIERQIGMVASNGSLSGVALKESIKLIQQEIDKAREEGLANIQKDFCSKEDGRREALDEVRGIIEDQGCPSKDLKNCELCQYRAALLTELNKIR